MPLLYYVFTGYIAKGIWYINHNHLSLIKETKKTNDTLTVTKETKVFANLALI